MSVSATTIRCPVCVDSVSSRWGSREGQAIFECGACGLTFFDLSSFTTHDYRDYYRYTENWSEADIVYEVEVRRRRTVHLPHLHFVVPDVREDALEGQAAVTRELDADVAARRTRPDDVAARANRPDLAAIGRQDAERGLGMGNAGQDRQRRDHLNCPTYEVCHGFLP